MKDLTAKRVDEALTDLQATGPTRDGLERVGIAIVEMIEEVEHFLADHQSETGSTERIG